MSTAADEKRWAIAPPASDDSTDLGNELHVDEGSRSHARKRSTGTSPSRRYVTEPAGSASDESGTITRVGPEEVIASEEENLRQSDGQASRRSPPRSSTSTLRRRATLPAVAPDVDSSAASSSRELETLAPESSSPFASEPAISERIPRGRRSRRDSEGGDTIPAPTLSDDAAPASTGMGDGRAVDRAPDAPFDD